MTQIGVRCCTPALGAQVTGVDLSRPVDDAAFQRILDIFHEHSVIFFRGQDLGPEAHIAFSRRFGELEIHVRKDCLRPGYPELFVVSNIIENGKPIGTRDAGEFWHSDLCYMREPSRGSLFYAREVPEREGVAYGDTLFASACAAYDALPDDIKRRLAGLKAVHSYVKGYHRPRKSGPRPELTEEQKRRTPDVEHPLVRTHPETGRKCLFVNEGYTQRIVGLPQAESDELLEFLFAHITSSQFVYRHRWRAGDFLIWDNCAVQHRAMLDYELPLRRRMERTTLTGTVPF
jgi:taurine dioxygenase